MLISNYIISIQILVNLRKIIKNSKIISVET